MDIKQPNTSIHPDINTEIQRVVEKLAKFGDEQHSHSFTEDFISLIFGSLRKWASLNTKLKKVPNGICVKHIDKDSRCYQCWDCESTGDTHLICNDCFDIEQHKGHRYQISCEFEGFCDCGVINAVQIQGCCSKHRGYEQLKSSYDDMIPEQVCIKIKILLQTCFSNFFMILDKNIAESKINNIHLKVGQ